MIACITGIIFGVFQANEGKRKANEERFPRRLCLSLINNNNNNNNNDNNNNNNNNNNNLYLKRVARNSYRN